MSNAPALDRFNPAQPGAAGMKRAATGLLFVMAAIFAAARTLEPSYPWLSWVKAFAEAAMVGGLIFSTVLTLLLVPAYFSIAIDVERWLGAKFGKLIDNGEPHVPMAEPLPAE